MSVNYYLPLILRCKFNRNKIFSKNSLKNRVINSALKTPKIQLPPATLHKCIKLLLSILSLSNKKIKVLTNMLTRDNLENKDKETQKKAWWATIKTPNVNCKIAAKVTSFLTSIQKTVLKLKTFRKILEELLFHLFYQMINWLTKSWKVEIGEL